MICPYFDNILNDGVDLLLKHLQVGNVGQSTKVQVNCRGLIKETWIALARVRVLTTGFMRIEKQPKILMDLTT